MNFYYQVLENCSGDGLQILFPLLFMLAFCFIFFYSSFYIYTPWYCEYTLQVNRPLNSKAVE
jgi:hypothetical protein